MTIETELKLRITPQQLAKLKRHALLQDHQLARAVTRRLYNIYFDTPELALHQSAMALRLRRQGSQWLQTLKGGGSIQAGLHQRNEWEVPVRGAALDFSHTAGAAWDELLPASWREQLQPIFVTDFLRSSRTVVWQGAHIEVCMDQGEIKCGPRSHAICELELELKSGEPRQLFALAVAILDVVPFEIEMVNKAEYGFRLLGNFVEQPHPYQADVPTQQDSLTQGWQALLWSCVLHVQKNWSGALNSTNPDFLHQVRVALRRWRVLLRMVRQLGGDEQLAVLTTEIAQLSAVLGEVRDWDVLLTQALQPLNDGTLLANDHAAWWSACQVQRADCYAALQVQSRKMQSLMLRFAIWMQGDYWSRVEPDAPSARDFATHRLTKLTRRFVRILGRLDQHDAEALHRLRIQTKQLRYSAEACAGWFNDPNTAGFLNALADLQQVLGRINDAAVVQRLLAELVNKHDFSAQLIEAVGKLIAHEHRHDGAALKRALRHVDKQPLFWQV